MYVLSCYIPCITNVLSPRVDSVHVSVRHTDYNGCGNAAIFGRHVQLKSYPFFIFPSFPKCQVVSACC